MMISSLMEYDGYHAKIEFDQDDQIFVGHVLGINDSINFHGQSVDELKSEFQNAVLNYREYCEKIGKAPEKEYKGAFNVRIRPEQHRKVALRAASEGITINQFVSRAIDDELTILEG
ncbi:type II toxin-antitoxin system HicB family antitoxin [Oribacterium sp. P6A1]|uniref:type II toxin-antitoxin system HicB family antitoxin n=1 Tax=Oribacterium sp. P6A1 TaxID=1410612 RepID=UPI001FA73FAB|nr:type II toxin-antitoxin system HicB family antitoxin [Oribacterium sp. P6A1]